MRREISSPITIINKVLVLVIFGIVFPVLVFILFGSNVFSPGNLCAATAYTVFAVLLIRYVLNLKRVEMTDGGLFISKENFGKSSEIFVPFEEIKNVAPIFFDSKCNYLIIKFKGPTRFGTKVTFAATGRFNELPRHLLVKLLNDKAQNARSKAQTKAQNP